MATEAGSSIKNRKPRPAVDAADPNAWSPVNEAATEQSLDDSLTLLTGFGLGLSNPIILTSTSESDGYDPSKQGSVLDGQGVGAGCRYPNYAGLKQLGSDGSFGTSPLAHQTMGNCAFAVRSEFQKLGVNMDGHPATAAQYETTGFLANKGFTLAARGHGEFVDPSFTPQDHSVAVFYDKSNPCDPGHVVFYDAQSKRWLSDFDPVSQGFRHTFSGLANPDKYEVAVYNPPASFAAQHGNTNQQVASATGGASSPSPFKLPSAHM